MKITSRLIGLAAVLLLSLFALGANAQKPADGEPTLAQIYQAANGGDLPKAQGMIDQVLKAHPNSAKAHYVKAELAARDNDFSRAREELSTAEKLAPGLPFAKPQSVQALRNQISGPRTGSPSGSGSARQTVPAGIAERAPSGFSWGLVGLIAAVAAAGFFMLRARKAVRALEGRGAAEGGPSQAGATYPPPGPGGSAVSPNAPIHDQPSAASSMMRGLGTGLAVGAGALAAQELGRRMFSHEGQQAGVGQRAPGDVPPDIDAIDEGMRRNLNTDMGGDNFGASDKDGWDDARGDVGGEVGSDDWDT